MPEPAAFSAYGADHVIVPTGAALLDAYKHPYLSTLLLEDGKRSLEACRHPDKTVDAYVLSRCIVEPLNDYIQHIGANGKRPVTRAESARKRGTPATSLSAAATPVISPPPALPPLPTPALPSPQLLEIMPDEVIAHIFSQLDLRTWITIGRMHSRLRALAVTPTVFAGVLSGVPAAKVHRYAQRFIVQHKTVIESGSDMTLLMDGFCRRYANVEGARYHLLELCRTAAYAHQPALLSVILERNSLRGAAVVDLREIMFNDTFFNVKFENTTAPAYTVDALMAWHAEVDAQIPARLFPPMFDIDNKLNSSVLYLRQAFGIGDGPIVEFIVRSNSIEFWLKHIIAPVKPAQMRSIASLLPLLLDTAIRRGIDVQDLMMRLAMNLTFTVLDLDALKAVARWRGSRGEYINIAQCIDTVFAIYAAVHVPSNTLPAKDIERYLAFYLEWRSPDGTAFLDLRKPHLLNAILDHIRESRGRLIEEHGAEYQLKIDAIMQRILLWRDPIDNKNVPFALFVRYCAGSLFTFNVLDTWFDWHSPDTMHTTEVMSESEMRDALSRHASRLFTWFILSDTRHSHILDFCRGIFSVLVGGTQVVPLERWLTQNGGAELLGCWNTQFSSLRSALHFSYLFEARNNYDLLQFVALLCSSTTLLIKGIDILQLTAVVPLLESELPPSILAMQYQYYQQFYLSAAQKKLLSTTLLALANRLRVAAGLSQSAITEVLDF